MYLYEYFFFIFTAYEKVHIGSDPLALFSCLARLGCRFFCCLQAVYIYIWVSRRIHVIAHNNQVRQLAHDKQLTSDTAFFRFLERHYMFNKAYAGKKKTMPSNAALCLLIPHQMTVYTDVNRP